MKLAELHARGFDASTRAAPYNRVKCSQCAAAVINGIPAHEHGCPNATRLCHECGTARVSVRQKYCDDCTREVYS